MCTFIQFGQTRNVEMKLRALKMNFHFFRNVLVPFWICLWRISELSDSCNSYKCIFNKVRHKNSGHAFSALIVKKERKKFFQKTFT